MCDFDTQIKIERYILTLGTPVWLRRSISGCGVPSKLKGGKTESLREKVVILWTGGKGNE